MPLTVGEATGHRHSESCQQRWHRHSAEGQALPPRVHPLGANSDPSTAPLGLAACCTGRAFCNLCTGTSTLFSWHCHVRVSSLEDLGVGVGEPSTAWPYPLL